MPYAVDAFNISHPVFQIFPPNTNDLSLSTCMFDIISRWALDIFLGQYNKLKAKSRASLYYTLSSLAGAEPLLGHMFEAQVLNYLDPLQSKKGLTLRQLSDSVEMRWTYCGPIRCSTFTKDTPTAEITNAVLKKVPVHLVPIMLQGGLPGGKRTARGKE